MKRLLFIVNAILVFVYILTACGSKGYKSTISKELGIDVSKVIIELYVGYL